MNSIIIKDEDLPALPAGTKIRFPGQDFLSFWSETQVRQIQREAIEWERARKVEMTDDELEFASGEEPPEDDATWLRSISDAYEAKRRGDGSFEERFGHIKPDGQPGATELIRKLRDGDGDDNLP